MHFSFALSLVAALSAIAPASAGLLRRQSTQVYKLPNNGRLENIAVRPNGQLLLTRFDAPELWTFDPTTKQGSRLFSFTKANVAAGITEVSPDVFAVIAGNMTGGNKPGSWSVWKVDLTGATPQSSLIKAFSDSGLFNGLTTLNNDTVLIADGAKGAVIRLKVSTAESSVAIQDASMNPPANAPIALGIDGLRYSNGTIYYTNIFKNQFLKLKVDETGKAIGSPITVLTDANGGDDLTIGPDGAAYIALQTKGTIVKVTEAGKSSTVATVAGGTAVAFGRTDKDKNLLYVTINSGSVVSIPVTF